MEKFIIDRIEEGTAVLETEEKTFVNVPLSDLPLKVREGDVLTFSDGEYLVDKAVTSERKEKIKSLLDGIMEK